MMLDMELPRSDPFDERQKAMNNDIVLSRVRSQWFENYEKNLPLIQRWGGIQKMPQFKKLLVCGAGWTLIGGEKSTRYIEPLGTATAVKVRGNIRHLDKIPVPIIACDKSAPHVAKYAQPDIVTALNTGHTDVASWLTEFQKNMAEYQLRTCEDVWLLVPVTVNPAAVAGWPGKIAFMNPLNTCPELTSTVQKETGLVPQPRGDNVGFFSVIMAVALGAEELAYCGMPYSFMTAEEVLTRTAGGHFVGIKDPFKRMVYTSLDWIDARREFLDYCAEANEVCRIVNCSEGGILYEKGVVSALPLAEWGKYL